MKSLKDYLHYRITQKEYEAKVAAATLSFDEFCKNHVQNELQKFDLAEKAKQEALKWQWSPLFQVLKKWPLKKYNSGPWEHTNQEWVQISEILLENVNIDALSLDNKCPHILRAIFFMRILEGDKRLLAHPIVGLNTKFLLELAQSKDRSIPLRTIVRNLPCMGDFYFSHICDAAKSFSVLHNDIVGMLGCEPTKQQEVVEKIQSFTGKLAYRAIADLLRMNHTSELADMWYSKDISTQRQERCEEVNTLLYLVCIIV